MKFYMSGTMTLLLIWSEPVSYTHLDVYKRQVHSILVRNFNQEADNIAIVIIVWQHI